VREVKKLRNGLKPDKELQELRARIAELDETLRAIRMGEVDAVLVSSPKGEQVFTLQGAEHPYRILVERIDEGAATLGEDGTILYANRSFARIFGVPLEKCIGAHLLSFVSAHDREFLETLITSARIGSTRGEIRLQMRGKSRTVRLTLSPTREQGMETLCVVATELTELVETNEALRVTEASLRQLSARLLQLQDEERRRIARDLHDITGQKIVVLSMALDRLARHPQLKDPEAQETVRESREMVSKIGEETRTLSYLLHPPLLDECGLDSAVRWYAEGFEKRSGIKLSVDIPQDLGRLPTEIETALFRVIQESLTNVHRYSGSDTAEIRVRATPDEVRLEIVDYGKGGNAKEVQAAVEGGAPLGVGIPGMRERLHQLGGRLDVDFAREGTKVIAALPVRKAAGVAAQGSQREAAPEVPTDVSTRRRILIADDHEMMRRGLRGLIESHQEWAVCGEAVEGDDAVRKSVELNPDLVIMDINMPGLSGIDAALRIRKENAATRILFFTVHDSDQVLQEIVDVGAQGYVAKSRAGQDLVEAVRSVLNGKTFFPSMATAAGRAEAGLRPSTPQARAHGQPG
jgi:PAS domain S-box-containing protein